MPEQGIPPPYPADTRAKGWRFELDYEKIDQSDTWSLAADVPLARPCLLMMWLAAWTQDPCGSLPNEEAVIRARCQIPAATWAKVRGILMRGWWLASDGRLYHDTLTKRVEEMIEYRRKNAKRVSDFKAAKREQQGGNALPPGEERDSNDTGTGTGTKKRKDSAVALLVAEGIPEDMATDFMALRRAKKAPMTPTALKRLKSEADKAGMSLPKAVETCCGRGWAGFEAKWLVDPSDVRGITVPGRAGPDPAIKKLNDDKALTAPPPAHIREELKKLAGAKEMH